MEVGEEREDGMSEHRTGAVGGVQEGNDSTRSLAFTERSSQPAHQYSLSRSSSRLQRGWRNKVAEVKLFTRWREGRAGGRERAPPIRVLLSPLKKMEAKRTNAKRKRMG